MPISTTPQSRAARARLARSAQDNGPDAAATHDARRDFNAARLDDYIRHTLSQAPPLTEEQRTRLAELLRPAREAVGSPAADGS